MCAGEVGCAERSRVQLARGQEVVARCGGWRENGGCAAQRLAVAGKKSELGAIERRAEEGSAGRGGWPWLKKNELGANRAGGLERWARGLGHGSGGTGGRGRWEKAVAWRGAEVGRDG